MAERIRKAVASVDFLRGSSLPSVEVTVSVGVAACPDNGSSPEELIYAADAMLYRAKREGKNRVVAAGPCGLRPSGTERILRSTKPRQAPRRPTQAPCRSA